MSGMPPGNRTIALVDPEHWIGHHPFFFLQYVRCLAEKGCNVQAFCRDPEAVALWTARSPASTVSAHRIHVVQHWALVRVLRRAVACASRVGRRNGSLLRNYDGVCCWVDIYLAIRRASRRSTMPELVFFLWLDTYLVSRGPLVSRIASRFTWSGLYFYPVRYRTSRPLGSEEYEQSLRPESLLIHRRCASIAVLDEGIVDRISTALGGKTVMALPDLADESDPDILHELYAYVKDRSYGRSLVGLFGSLDRRKGVLTFLRACRRMRDGRFLFLLAGKLFWKTFPESERGEISAIMAECRDNLVCSVDDFVSDEGKLNSLIGLCNVLFLAYHDFPHSSNFLAKAAVFRVPVLVSDGYLMAERVRKHNMGLVIPENNVEACVQGIAALCSSFDRSAARFDEYHSQHCYGALCERMGTVLEHAGMMRVSSKT